MVRIKRVMPGSWAEAEGVLAGDQLLKLNDVETAGLSQEDIGKALRSRPLRLRPLAHTCGGASEALGGGGGHGGAAGLQAGVAKCHTSMWRSSSPTAGGEVGLRVRDVLEEIDGQQVRRF